MFIFSFKGSIQIPLHILAKEYLPSDSENISRGLQSQTTLGCQPKDWVYQDGQTPSSSTSADANQPSHPLSSPSPPAFNVSQQQEIGRAHV